MVINNNKYKNTKLWYDTRNCVTYPTKATADCICFDSRFELIIYQLLRDYYPRDAILIHHPIVVKPATKRYPALKWRVDFYIDSSKDSFANQDILVEAKGVPTPDFKHKLQLFELQHPDLFPYLYIVGNYKSEKIDRNVTSMSKEDLINKLKQFKRMNNF